MGQHIYYAIQLIATVSSYLWVGPRVTWAMAMENKLWQPLAKKNRHGIPVAAVWLHVFISASCLHSPDLLKVLLLYCRLCFTTDGMHSR